MKRKGKLRKTRKQRAGGTRQMAARIYIDPQGQGRVNVHQDLTQEQFQELLHQFSIYLEGFTSGGRGFVISYPFESVNSSINDHDFIFRHVRASPEGHAEVIDFPPTLPHRLEQVAAAIDVFGERYFLLFSPSNVQNLNSSLIEI